MGLEGRLSRYLPHELVELILDFQKVNRSVELRKNEGASSVRVLANVVDTRDGKQGSLPIVHGGFSERNIDEFLHIG